MIEVKQFNADDAVKLCGDETKRNLAEINEKAGPARSIYLDGELLCCGGIRELGLGEAWFIIPHELRESLKSKKFSKEKYVILREGRKQLDDMAKDFYRVYAEARLAERFCKAMGFIKKDNIYIRG